MSSTVSWRSRNSKIGANWCAGRKQTQQQCLGWANCHVRVELFITPFILSLALSGRTTIASPVDEGVTNFNYFHLWTSHDGETHVKECSMHNFTLTTYAALPQYIKSDFGGQPSQLTFSQLPRNFYQGLHHPPAVQFAVTLAGTWYVLTTDGSKTVFNAGDIVFQDNIRSSPAAKPPKHKSGTIGDDPCRQVLVQLTRPPELDNPCPF